MNDRKSRNNQALQAERRRMLLEATMDAIHEFGLSNVTLAKIAGAAGLSAGSVNFHFDSKQALLLATLTQIAEEFEVRIQDAVDTAGSDPGARLLALIDASLDPEITQPRKTAVWFAFASEARSRDDYQRICGEREKESSN